MKTLPLKLRKNGFNYTQVQRGKRSCIYEQRVSENSVCFEVFLIKIRPERKVRDKTLEAAERFPNNEAFGYWAWTYKNYEDAINKFNEIEKEY